MGTENDMRELFEKKLERVKDWQEKLKALENKLIKQIFMLTDDVARFEESKLGNISYKYIVCKTLYPVGDGEKRMVLERRINLGKVDDCGLHQWDENAITIDNFRWIKHTRLTPDEIEKLRREGKLVYEPKTT